MANMCLKCTYYNHGWCKKYKMQRPKAIEVCIAPIYDDNDNQEIININNSKNKKNSKNNNKVKEINKDIEIPNKKEFIDMVKDMFCEVDNEDIDVLEEQLVILVRNIGQIEKLNIILGRE